MQDCPSMQSTQGIGWIVLRSRDPEGLASFYKKVLRLPELRSWPGGHMLWAGHYSVLEINVLDDGAPDQSSNAPNEVDVLPVYSAASLELVADLGPAVDLSEKGMTVQCYQDPDGNWFAIHQEQNDSSQFYPTLPNVDSLPDSFFGLSRVLIRSEQSSRQFEFYSNLFYDTSEPEADSLFINSGATLDFRKGTPIRHEVTDREQVQRVFIPRVFGYRSFVQQAESLGAHKVNELEFKGGMLSYYLDPQGQLFGFQERKPYDPDVPTSQAIEDKMSREAFISLNAA